MSYDFVVVGAGPAGLTLGWYLAKYGFKVLLIDRENEIGGCHRVRRVGGLFTEHGPRIIIQNYFCLIDMLRQFGVQFDDLYTVYDFSTNTSTREVFAVCSWAEILAFVGAFIQFMFVENPSKNITVEKFMLSHNFSPNSMAYIDKICRLTDGGTASNYTLFELLQIFNQNFFYKIYQPKYPNDVGLFKIWSDALRKTNLVDILLGTQIKQIDQLDDQIKIITTTGIVITGSNYIFAIPPRPMLRILYHSSDPNIFGNVDELAKWEVASRYLVYIPITFHWDQKLPLEKKWGVPDSSWDLVYVIMSDYMNFDDARSKTVIVCTVKNTNAKSNYTGKTANESTKSELISEVFRQLKIDRPTLPNPQFSILNPGVYKNSTKWDTIDTAYFFTTTAGYISNKSTHNNIWWVGTHNGHSSYSFTSMQSAMENAIYLIKEIIPRAKTDILSNHKILTFKYACWILIIIIIIILIIIINRYKKLIMRIPQVSN